MEAWSLHMLGVGLLRNGDLAGAREAVEGAIRLFQAAGDAAGVTLTLDDLSAISAAEGDLPRAARLRGAARNLTAETGAGLAGYVEESFESRLRPGVRPLMSADDLARYGAEGAAMTLEQAVAYALGGAPDPPRRVASRHDRRPDPPGRPASDRVAGRRPRRRRPEPPDPAVLMLTCANCGAAMDERKCKLICRCGYFLSCSDYA